MKEVSTAYDVTVANMASNEYKEFERRRQILEASPPTAGDILDPAANVAKTLPQGAGQQRGIQPLEREGREKTILSPREEIASTGMDPVMNSNMNCEVISEQCNDERPSIHQDKENNNNSISQIMSTSVNDTSMINEMGGITSKLANQSSSTNKRCNCCVDSSQIDLPINLEKNENLEFREKSSIRLQSLVSDEVVNLSSHDLTNTELSVLKYGLNFCPTPGAPKGGEILKELSDFSRKVNVKCHFLNQPTKGNMPIYDSCKPFSNLEAVSKIKKPSSWLPSHTPPTLEFMFNLNEHEINMGKLSAPKRTNLSKGEMTSLKNLSKMKNIIINKADKGGAVVNQDTTSYIKQSEKELSDGIPGAVG